MTRRFIQMLIVLLPIGLFAWLVVLEVRPSGVFAVEHLVNGRTPYIDRILPDDRILPIQYTNQGEPFTTIIDEPTYFSVHFPNTNFEQVELEVLFRNHGQSIFEVGALVDIFSQAYDLKPLQNGTIEELDWPELHEGDMRLFQRHADFASVEAFSQNLPDRSRVATYHYDIEQPYRLADYTPLGGERNIDASLRGFHKFVTYVKEEPVSFSVTFMDMNRKVGADEVKVVVRDEQKNIILERSLDDDGNIDENQISTTRTISFDESGWPEGVYTFELVGTSDIFWRNITTNLRYVTFINTLYIGDDVGHLPDPRATTFYTNAKNFALETLHADAVQRVGIGTEEIHIAHTHEKIRASIEDTGVVEGVTPLGDVKIVGDGKFAFSRDAFFDPDPVRLGPLTDLDALGIDYVVTNYQSPEQEGNWLKQTAVFDIAEIKNQENGATFTFSAPLIGEEQQTIDIHAINVRFVKEPMTASEFLRALRDLLPFGL